jgi:hypothetical protein
MKENLLFEYAVIRVVPMVEREEFLNVGVVLFCKKENFLECKHLIDKERIESFNPTIDLEEVEQHLMAFQSICKGSSDAGTIGALDSASRFRWLTATRSTIIQCSKVHPGLSTNLEETLAKLFSNLVLLK